MDGWIDLQVNGYGGVDFNAPGLTVEAVRAVTERLAADGTVGPFLHLSYAVFCITLHSFNIVWSGNRHGLTAF